MSDPTPTTPGTPGTPTAALAPEELILRLARTIDAKIRRDSERGSEVLLSVLESADANPAIVIAQPYGISSVTRPATTPESP